MIDAAKYGPWAVVAGGSESLGASFAKKLGAAGLNLVLIARKEGPLEEVAAKVRGETGVQVRTLSLDLARAELLGRVREATHDIEVGMLVYNAGAADRRGAFLKAPVSDALRMITVNTVGPVVLAHYFAARMAERGRGGIITIGSFGGLTGAPGTVVYNAAKSFSQIFTEGLWAELRQHGIDVLHVPLTLLNSPAMARMGFVFRPEHRPVDPDRHVDEILENLTNGPVFISPQMMRLIRHIQSLPRRAAVEQMAEMESRLIAAARTRQPG